MFKKLLVLIPTLLLAFQSKFTPHLNKYFKDYRCNIVLHKKAFDICYSCSKKEPDFVAYTLYGNLVNKNNYSRKHISFRPDYNLPRKYRSYSKDCVHSAVTTGDIMRQMQALIITRESKKKPF